MYLSTPRPPLSLPPVLHRDIFALPRPILSFLHSPDQPTLSPNPQTLKPPAPQPTSNPALQTQPTDTYTYAIKWVQYAVRPRVDRRRRSIGPTKAPKTPALVKDGVLLLLSHSLPLSLSTVFRIRIRSSAHS
ncbi:uncharacterized protein BKA78DRAFT_310440 [Phyllosticta capitalensis]|uniref:uncharacterized protein n=1 Tax=Phyllosticta capitalensis TaxID=121624 RepID=UPI00312EA15A